MAIWPFNRNENETSILPPEVKEYYQAERRERTSVAWLLAGATVLITVALALGLFFGGRALYRRVANRNDTSTQPQEATPPPTEEEATPAPEETPPPAPGPATTPSSTPAPNPAPSPTPIPRTGPEEESPL